MNKDTHDLESLLADESFQRWLSGRAFAEEEKKWTAWLNETPMNQELYSRALKVWYMAHFREASLPDIELEWQKLRSRLRAGETARSASIRTLPSQKTLFRNDPNARFSWARYGAIAVAASLVIALLWRFVPFQKPSSKQEYQIVATDFGQRSRITLPDSTTIILNGHSSLRYPAVWTAATAREFELQGEAYFDVSSLPEGPQHDFVVHTADGDIRVVGTRFVVNVRGRGTRVVVEEGGVQVTVASTTAAEKNPASKILIKPDHLLEFHKDSRVLSPQVVNIGLYTTWWRDELVLEETPFEQVVQRLEETYGVTVQVKDKRLLERTLSGSMENRNLDVMMQALAKALRTTVSREGQVIIFGI
jgi:ferric-dicitrate binding protein FerR (iron transport regulator)